jgi:nitrate reductase delta subunit
LFQRRQRGIALWQSKEETGEDADGGVVMRARTFKVLSALLTYPSVEMQAAAMEMREVVRTEGLLGGRDLAALERLIEEVGQRDIYDLQERYTLLFDRTRSLSLHLFEHVHGESRDRGQAMVDLASHYERHGFLAAPRELPDFLPMVLEFLSVLPFDEAQQLLRDPLPIVGVLEERLRKRKSPYASIFRAARAIAKCSVDPARLAELRAELDVDADDLTSLDAEWEEAAVQFGPTGADDACGRGRLATRLRAAARSVAPVGRA